MLKFAVPALALTLAGCATTDKQVAASQSCAGAPKIGLFDPARDLLVANYDGKPDVDDLQAVAGLGSVLKDPAFACVDYVATAGAYGSQGGEYLAAPELFDLAFGDRWLDAHGAREETIGTLARRMLETTSTGGRVWVAEAGQSDVTAAAVRRIPEELWRRVHVVQHSYWNESQTGAEAIQTVVYNTSYHRVQDGNFADNGSPAFNTKDGSHWAALLSHPEVGPLWTEAKRLSDLHNPRAAYVNPAVAAGGLDFSDTVEVAYIFGFDDMAGVGDFVARFAD
ncbi:hypothetical protein [Sphingomicrobium aestuariivivum]|uniref:hypothetical protein n=1 Tax=Sphingomicrobium aestuariivivum TaxID=1582356 RepID=UPI001FD67D9B|nr:hypothetical protein [Sphingomicrobium aestuariivivum]MCJ8190694.1 hypothetical protein [Sphingomicrobium aestuariivivum]